MHLLPLKIWLSGNVLWSKEVFELSSDPVMCTGRLADGSHCGFSLLFMKWPVHEEGRVSVADGL